jgi:CPA2 family monovalent cation:H+ antiporter-2
MLAQHALPIVVISIAVIVGKILACSFGAFAGGQDMKTSLRVGMGLAQIGEFSFIIAALGQTLGVTSSFLYPIAVTVSAITTLTTPYLIRSSDSVVNLFTRTAPVRLTGLLDIYTRWIGNVAEAQSKNMGRRLLRRWTVMMLINLLFVAGIFIGGAFLANARPSWLLRHVGRSEWLNPMIWLAAMVASLPFLIATYRKLQAFGMLVAELKVRKETSGERRRGLQGIVANAVLISGAILIGVLLVALSSTILPPGKSLLLLLVIVGMVAAVLWRPFIRIYSKGQIAVEGAFTAAQTHAPRHRVLPDFLKEAELERMEVVPRSIAANKLISELRLRTVTGASIVAIQRDGKSILNPSPNEDILPGDHLLLLGSAEQLSAARILLAEKTAEPLPQ